MYNGQNSSIDPTRMILSTDSVLFYLLIDRAYANYAMTYRI